MKSETIHGNAEANPLSFKKNLYKKALIPYRKIRNIYDRAYFLPKIATRIATIYEAPKNFLDIGSGRGYLGNALIAEFPDANVVSADVTKDVHVGKSNYVVSHADHLPFKDQAFDVSTIFYVLHHMNNPLAALKEAKRVSKKIIVHEDMYRYRWQRWLIDDHVQSYQQGNPVIGATVNTEVEWHQLFDDAGLQVTQRRRIRRLGYPVPRYEYHLEQKYPTAK